MKNKSITSFACVVISAEMLSFLGYYYQIINFISFFAIAAIVFILSLRKLEYGLFALLAELIIGSFGYLFYFENNGFKISIRITLWLIIMSVWLANEITKFIKTKKFEIYFFRSSYLFYFLFLFIFIIFGAINGFARGNLFNDIFFDFNNWLYFPLIFPIFSVFQNDDNLKTAKQIFLVSIIWLSVKTIILAYIFSHNFIFFIPDIYLWIRQSGVGEITQVVPGFSRIFMQSHIFVLIGFFALLFYLPKRSQNSYAPILALPLSAIIISFSRSFWIGLAVGGFFFLMAIIFKLKIKLKKFIALNSIALSAAVLSLALAFFIVKFPFPAPAGNFDATNLLSQRASQISSEAGVSSRWRLLPQLWKEIKKSPISGQGFGATVTYQSYDPRILKTNSQGEYTTYAFEWGWLDIWLKLGILGLTAYIILFIKLIFDGLKINSRLSLSLTAGLIIIFFVSIFSPYANHPLGIGYIIAAAAIMEKLKITIIRPCVNP
ncbi:MAG: O-antigen ligase family protein [bacterium]